MITEQEKKGEGTPLSVPIVKLRKIRTKGLITEFEYRIMVDNDWIGLIRKYSFDDKPNISIFMGDVAHITIHNATGENIEKRTDEPWIRIKS